MKKISLTTEDIKNMVKKTTEMVLKESDVLNSAFNSGGNRGDVKVSTLNDGTIQVEIIADTYTFVTEWTGKDKRTRSVTKPFKLVMKHS